MAPTKTEITLTMPNPDKTLVRMRCQMVVRAARPFVPLIVRRVMRDQLKDLLIMREQQPTNGTASSASLQPVVTMMCLSQ